MASLKRKSQSLGNDYLDSSDDERNAGNEETEGEGTEIKLKLNKKKGQEEDEGIKLKKKEGKKRVKVETDRLIGVDGLRRVYEEFPLICEFKGRGTEVCTVYLKFFST